MRIEAACFCRCAIRTRLVGLLAGVEEGVERAFGVDDQLAAARQPDDHVGAKAAVVGVDRHFGLEIGIRREAGLLEHVLEALLAPAAARLGAGAKRVDQTGGFVADLAVAGVKQGHRLAQRLVAAHPLLLDLGQPLLIALERRLDRLEQRLQLRVALLARLVEAGVGALEELLLRLAQQFRADLVELGGELLLGLHQLLHPRLEIARIGLEPGEIAYRRVALPGDLGQATARKALGGLAAFLGDRAGAATPDDPAERNAGRDESGDQEESQRIHFNLSMRNEART